MEHRWLFSLGGLFGFLAVATGAFGAHALKNRLSQEMLAIFEVGVRYQMYHALALLVVAFIPGFQAAFAGWAFLLGTLVFSGSLYALSISGIKVLGAITPIGGLLLLVGWIFLILTPFFTQR
ncbi:MAG: hypothetical protein S4CHLAM2_00560 [Chlamydiales bacterium]|nr:hypothetical protein [Chlamydiales bacterium]